MDITNTFDMSNIIDACMKTINSRIQNLNVLNIAVIGKTGVGKSTLINAIFREKLAETGVGSPITNKMTQYTKKGFPLKIYDTKGLELGGEEQQEVKNELLKLIKDGVKSRDINEALHCIWYCINTQSDRFEDKEKEWIKELTEYKVPVIIVLTKSFSKEQAQKMKQEIEKYNLNIKQIVTILAKDYKFDDKQVVEAYGMDTLIEVMGEILPSELVDTLMNVQKVNLKLKRKRSMAAVTTAVMSATAAGAIPIPFSDAALLIPIEVTMITSITVIFGFSFDKSILTALISAVFGTGGATIGGRAIASNLLKMIPGIGTATSMAISGGTATVLTAAMGKAYIEIMTAMFKGELKKEELATKDGQEKFEKIFMEEFQKKI